MAIGRHALFVVAFTTMFGASGADVGDFAEGDYFELDRWFAGVGGALALPEGGSSMGRVAGAAVRGGYYLNEFWAIEAEGAWAENRRAVASGILWHWWGYERLDPFFTFGFRDWIDTDFGPCGGLGSFWHIDDRWSLRFDAGATLGVSDGCDMLYQFSAGVQRSW